MIRWERFWFKIRAIQKTSGVVSIGNDDDDDQISHAPLRLFLVTGAQRPSHADSPPLQGVGYFFSFWNDNNNNIWKKITKITKIPGPLPLVDWWTCRIVRYTLSCLSQTRKLMDDSHATLNIAHLSSSVRHVEDDPTSSLRWWNADSTVSTWHSRFDTIGPIRSTCPWSRPLFIIVV